MDRFDWASPQSLERHSRLLTGMVAAIASVAATTVLVGVLKGSATVESLGVAYVPAVLLVASVWGGVPGYVTALLGAGAFNWFHLPPEGGFEIADGEDWVALAVLLVVARWRRARWPSGRGPGLVASVGERHSCLENQTVPRTLQVAGGDSNSRPHDYERASRMMAKTPKTLDISTRRFSLLHF